MKFDAVLVFIIIVLAAVGLVMVYSASTVVSIETYNQSEYYFKKQMGWVLAGIIVMIVAGYFDYRYFRTAAIPLVIITMVLMGLTMIPGLGVKVGGATRWLNLGLFRLQSSELAKITVIIFTALFCSDRVKKGELADFKKVVLPALLFICGICGLVLLQRDLSTAVLIFGTGITILYFSGAKIRDLTAIFLVGIIAVISIIYFTSYRMERVLAFLYPEKYKYEEGYQSNNSLIAVGSGGKFGLGLGKSIQKFNYLPVAYSDFIFSIIGEELGMCGTVGVILLFMIFFIKGMRIFHEAPDDFAGLIAIGIVSGIIYQALLNIGVVLRMLPTTGVTLPFISYGGSSMLVSFALVGILLNISGNCGVSRKREHGGRS